MNYKTTFTLAAIAAAVLAIGIVTPVMSAYAAGSASSAATGDPLGTASAGSGSNTNDRTQGSAATAGALGTRASGGDSCSADGATADDGGCANAD
jgi:hypothetical protein